MSCGGSMKKMAKGGAITKGGSNTEMGIYGIPNAGRTDSLGFKKGGTVKLKARLGMSVQPPVTGKPKPTLKPLNGSVSVILNRKPNTGPKPKITLKKGKVGGTVNASKFAALAPPYNKATFADRIAGAKKTKKK